MLLRFPVALAALLLIGTPVTIGTSPYTIALP
jgi:hypothetical protein